AMTNVQNDLTVKEMATETQNTQSDIVHLPGSLDKQNFNSSGIVTTSFGDLGTGAFRGAQGVGVQPDGKIVAVGGSSDKQFAVARYLSNGALDSSFGNGGM